MKKAVISVICPCKSQFSGFCPVTAFKINCHEPVISVTVSGDLEEQCCKLQYRFSHSLLLFVENYVTLDKMGSACAGQKTGGELMNRYKKMILVLGGGYDFEGDGETIHGQYKRDIA